MSRSPEAKKRRREREKAKAAERRDRERKEQDGKPCTYCARAMTISLGALYPTRDHVEPRSLGGKITVWACYTCNHVKRDMTERQWAIYRGTHDFWWLNNRARAAANWTPGRQLDNLPAIPSETGPEAEGIADALSA